MKMIEKEEDEQDLVLRWGWNQRLDYGSVTLNGITVEFYLYPTVGTVLIHSAKPELTE